MTEEKHRELVTQARESVGMEPCEPFIAITEEQLAKVQRELELMSIDAARYRWLKSLPRNHVAVACLDDTAALDDAIDAEMAKLEGRKP